jgi:hypothetical protein
MAKTPKTATALPLEGGSAENPAVPADGGAKPAVQPSFEPEAQYGITLHFPVVHEGTELSPRHARIVVKGKVAEKIKDAIATAEKL